MKNCKKNMLLSFLLVGATGATLLGAACSDGGKKKPSGVSTELSFVDNGQGLILALNGKYQTTAGALGVKVAYDEVDGVSDTFYAHYETVVKQDGGYLAEASVTTENGSVISVKDAIKEGNGKISVKRTLKVETAGAGDLGFTSFFPMETVEKKKAESYEWFSPANYYGNDEYTFSSNGVKTGFNGEESIVTADNMSAPLMMMYDGKLALSVLDKTAGLRETVGADMGVKSSYILIDGRVNMPGIGIANVEREDGNHTQIFHAYPAYSFNYLTVYPFNVQYRMLPMEENLSREIGFDWSVEDYGSFSEASEETWRGAYEDYAVVDKRYAATDVRDVLLRAVDVSYGVVGGVPQYMTNADHFDADSGFLYRNADLAWLMLAEGRRTMNETYVSHALSVLESQISLGRLDENLIHQDPLYKKRSASDALTSLVRAYENELENGVKHADWMYYLLQRANARANSENWIDAQFLSELARVTGNKTYTDQSVKLMESVREDHLKFRYTGAITNPNSDPFVDREAGIVALTIYINLYEQTGESKWLDMAKHTAFFVESWHQLQPILMEVYDCTGYERDMLSNSPTNQGFIGNGKIMPYGLSYIGGQNTSADISGVLAAPDFLRLYEITEDEHYFDFYEYITYNSTLYVNMGDKVGLMDDMIHSSGLGFINEYFGLSISGDQAVLRRGSVHDSAIAWCPFAILQNYERTYGILKEEGKADSHIVAVDDFSRSFDLSKNKYTTNVTDGTVIDLREVCNVFEVKGFDGEVSYSLDGEAWFKKDGDEVRAKFVKLHTQTKPESLEIVGLPVLYKNLTEKASSTSEGGADYWFAHDGDYATGWRIETNAVLTLDLGSVRDVYTVATTFSTEGEYTFKVEISEDGNVWSDYASFNGTSRVYVDEKAVTGVRYVRIVCGQVSAPRLLTEVKVLGI